MTDAPRLSLTQLAKLEALLIGQGAFVVRRFRPPASADALAFVEGFLDRPLPAEVRTWWEWHDGTEDGSGIEHVARELIGPSFKFDSTSQSICHTKECRDDAEGDPPGYLSWDETWLAIGRAGMVACDIAVAFDAPVPILDVDYHHVDIPGTVAARSFGEMVGWWIEALENGARVYDSEHDVWERGEDLVPPERAALV